MADAPTRATFLGIADVLIPEAEGMPAASAVGVGEMLDRLLGLRPDLVAAFRRGIAACAGQEPRLATERLNRDDPEALSAIGLIAAAAYYMAPRVRELIGYRGQESRPADPDETPPYVSNGMLKAVADRGPIYRPTPKR
ncbi:MAG: hypothetical protein ACREDL_11455 [Bradyrhizobium sp.]